MRRVPEAHWRRPINGIVSSGPEKEDDADGIRVWKTGNGMAGRDSFVVEQFTTNRRVLYEPCDTSKLLGYAFCEQAAETPSQRWATCVSGCR